MAAAAELATSAAEKGREWWARVKSTVGFEEMQEEEPQHTSLLNQINEATSLNKMQRIYGFLISLALALFFGFCSTFFVIFPTKFAILYTFANICALASTMFLSGPWTHIKKMMEKGRIVATIIYFASMFLTLFCAIHLHSSILTLLSLMIQLCALAWYSMSYVPYARQMAAHFLGIDLSDGGV